MRGYAPAQRWPWALLLLALAGESLATCPPCPPPPALCSPQGEAYVGECLYTMNNKLRSSLLLETRETYFGLTCPDNVFLGDPALPALETLSKVRKVILSNCGVAKGTVAEELTRLNVTAVDYLELKRLLPTKLQSDHFAGLDQIRTLVLSAEDTRKPLDADGSLFEPLTALTKLYVTGVRLPLDKMEHLPSNLEELSLRQCGIKELPDVILHSLTRLNFLIIVENKLQSPPNISAVPTLRRLTLNAPMLGRAPAPAGIVNFTIELIRNLQFEGECDALASFTVRASSDAALPERWVARCHQLTNMSLRLRNLKFIPDNALENATALRVFSLTGSRKLSHLPADLFKNTINLIDLDLSRNNLSSLPNGIFIWLNKLQQLKLSDNHLGIGGTTAIALKPLGALKDLKSLKLDRNPLGDLCRKPSENINTRDISLLHELKLESLSLSDTRATRICTDWQRDMGTLKDLDLSDNNITELGSWDLQWNRHDGVEVQVDLTGNDIDNITITEQDYNNTHRGPITVNFDVKSPLSCDCHMFFFAQALREKKLHARFKDLQCRATKSKSTKGKVPLTRVDPATMVCPQKSYCPRDCSCTLHYEVGKTIVQVDCHNRSLSYLPDLSKLPGTHIELNLTNNFLRTLPANLTSRITMLDLRYNKLEEFTASAVDSLLSGNRKVWLEGNRLPCGCSEELTRRLRALSSTDQIVDIGIATCDGGVTLLDAVHEGCWGVRAALWGVGGAAIALAISAAIFFALRKAVRLRLKAFLITRGLCVRWVKPDDDDDCLYDAFLSYSHEDWDISEIVRKNLEAGPYPLKLCVHWRDWPVGGWIPFQIANSVTKSRRTIILLSDNFMKSTWALVEFREAYARAIRETNVRLIVVILGDAPPADLCSELQHYINNNTYLKWGDSAFWERLRIALPEPRPVPLKRSKKVPKATPMPAPRAAGAHRPSPIFVVPMPDDTPDPAPAPSTPIVKFAHIDFPTPVKPLKQEFSPCA